MLEGHCMGVGTYHGGFWSVSVLDDSMKRDVVS